MSVFNRFFALILLYCVLSATDLFCQTSECSLPSDILDLVSKELPEVRPVSTSAIVEDWDQFLTTVCPTLISDDFNGDGIKDYVFIATSPKGNPYQLLAAQSKGQVFELTTLMDIGFGVYSRGLGFGLETYPKGSVDGISQSLELSYPGILLNKFESSTVLFYYDGDSYQKMYLGD